MKTLYLECHNGAAGDMLLAALYELCPDRSAALALLNSLGLDGHGVQYEAESATDHAVTGTHMHVMVHGCEEGHNHHEQPNHQGLEDIYAVLDGLHASAWVREQAKAVYRAIADAESAVHAQAVDQVHFHELGALDAVADVAGFCALLELLGPDRIACSPVAVGSGQVHCAHGVLPVPAPATVRLLEGVSITTGVCPGELCTPTGAALLQHFAQDFGPMPSMRLLRSGVGFGGKRFEETLNAVRAFWGEGSAPEGETVTELSCNLDDMTGEAIAFAVDRLLAAGALDAWTTPITMKKGRPAVTLSCLCMSADTLALTQQLLRHTTTLGVRQTQHLRFSLERRQELILTPHGPVRLKIASGFGVTRQKAEFDDLAAIAKSQDLSLEQVRSDCLKGL